MAADRRLLAAWPEPAAALRPPGPRRRGAKTGGGKGWGKTKGVIFVFLQGGPRHLDIWDPKPDAPDNIRGTFKPIATKVTGMTVTSEAEAGQLLDKYTLIRSVSYTPAGLFNHTAAIYQMMTGYTPDKVSPSGQLEPPSPKDYPCIGCKIARIKPPKVPMLPFVMLPRPLQESNVVGKGGTAGFLGPAHDPYYMFQDPNGLQHGRPGPPPGTDAERIQNGAALRDKVDRDGGHRRQCPSTPWTSTTRRRST